MSATDLSPVTHRESSVSRKKRSTQGRKYLILFIVSWNTLAVTFLSTSLLIATPEIAADLVTTSEILNITNAGVLIAMGCASLIWSPLAEIFTRRYSYNAALLFMFGASTGTALARNLATFTATRILSGLTGTYFMVSGQTIIADIFEPIVRGTAVGCLQIGGVAGSALGPSISGIIVTYSHWRNIYWLQVAMAGFGLVLSLLCIPDIESETRQLREDSEKSASSWANVIQRFNPMKVLRQLSKPQVLLSNLTCGFLAVTQYGLLTSVRHIINPRFGLTTPLVGGLFYLAPGVGFVVGSVIGGRLSDVTVRRYIGKRNGLRIPKDRLNSCFPCLLAILPISLLLYGWALERKIGGIALPIVMAFWIGAGLMGAWNGLNTYSSEVFPRERAEVVGSKYIMQYAFGAAATAAVLPLIDAVGVGWGFTIFTLLKVLGGGLVLVIIRFAPDAKASNTKSHTSLYAPANVARLKEIREEYDPSGIYTYQMPGGFKVATV